MIRIERGAEVDGPKGKVGGHRHGIWEYRVPSLGILGYSRQPLLDACRDIQRTGKFQARELCGIYREGHVEPDMTCPLGAGAAHTVWEPDKSKIRFAKFRERDASTYEVREAAE